MKCINCGIIMPTGNVGGKSHSCFRCWYRPEMTNEEIFIEWEPSYVVSQLRKMLDDTCYERDKL